MGSTPLVSVIVPTYKREAYLKLTLESIVSQTYKNIEIIVVDDGTPGDENEILCNSFSSIAYFKIENTGGPSGPRNFGISKSNGAYIAFVDDDDIWLPQKLQVQVDILEENNDFGLVHSCCNIIDEYGLETGEVIGRPGKPLVKHGKVFMRMIGNWTIMMPTPLVRKDVIDKVGLFNQNIPAALEDVEYWSRCAFHTKFYYVDEPLVNYRQHSSNISTNNKKYINLPLYLFKVVKQKHKQNIFSKESYKKLVSNLCFMQAKMFKINVLKTVSNLFVLNPFWFSRFSILKVIIKKTIS
ncbi:glycosyltransferase family 2 protein [Flavivirga algicola]|uniref:Glycosyltransferase n=1 Tax=Flavivirga algicola TaxID=2729136 RepID=A0ABX1RVG7_9FLAO|nr:glycosyltransferase [Flavivirga algicola]NMH86350.1 glycosyltransferase [Flavivirga algicola]